MSIINYRKRELNIKIVYVGPALGGKTTSIAALHNTIPSEKRTPLTSIDTEGDRTLFFDFFGASDDTVAGLSIRLMVYGVPGQSWYRTTRKTVLTGVDGLVFVADSSPDRLQDNLDAFEDLGEMLAEHGQKLARKPLVIQYNKRDLPYVLSVEKLDDRLNERGVPSFPTIATRAVGTREAFDAICRATMLEIRTKLSADRPSA